jgi:hypothetical protein
MLALSSIFLSLSEASYPRHIPKLPPLSDASLLSYFFLVPSSKNLS